MQRCPACNARLKERLICSRCRADLTALIGSEQAAQQWYIKAVEYYLSADIEQCIAANAISLSLHKTGLAQIFRDFIIQQQCGEILDLLAQRKLQTAKCNLYKLRFLLPYSKQLQHLNAFSDYLLVMKCESSPT
ncbi:MAG TPA: hypothetical protein EYQ43_02090 [Methyloprofundus sp.]|uniref:hypothetical protein n=1 Tax=Methyloprofundus sp. TaxID=2020875 RepID=UPI001816C4D1|nr:hypothetical protein [Methyloprofundus sp.]HIG64367.1 hypothetical protein [Methyloprofundus sp.]HIL78940.1 hypothetical protein [Methylococcales bacterium]